MYDWLITEHLASLLMDIETPFVLPFLESKFRDRVELCHDLLWKYLARHGRFLEASKILDELASSPELYAQFLTLSDPFSHLNLPDRIERLSLALGNARSEIRMTLEAAEFVQELEERLDVAKLQNEVLEAVIAQYGDVSEVSELNCVLFDISQLFNRFTRPLKLYECSLMLIHCSSYQDQLLVHQLWTSILEKTVIGNHFDALSQKIAELAKKLYPSPFAFPLNFILDSVMILALKHGQSTDLVGTTFIHSGVPVKDCLEQICELAHSQATFWTKDDNREFLFNVFIIIAGKSLDRHLLKSSDLLMMTNYLSKATIPPPVSGQLSVLRDRCK